MECSDLNWSGESWFQASLFMAMKTSLSITVEDEGCTSCCIMYISYAYVLLCMYCCLTYFSCQIAGWKSVSSRSCDHPHQHRFFLVSLRLKTNAEMVPKTPTCYCMLLM